MKNIFPAWIEKLLGKPGIILAFIWGFAEGTLFFVVPDLIISFVALFNIKKSLKHIGSLLAGALMFFFAVNNPEKAVNAVLKVPFVTEKMNEQVINDFEKFGCWALCVGPTSGIPYKLYAVNAPKYISFPTFLFTTIPSRLERFIVTWLIFSGLGFALNRRPKYKVKAGVIIYAIYWIIVYGIYWS